MEQLLLAGVGIWTWKAEKAAGFFAGVEPPKVRDVRKYNHAVGVLWFAYAAAFELLGLPLLFLKQNRAGFLLSVLGVVGITIALVAAYQWIQARFSDPKEPR